jgi:predicted transposase YdaD
MQNGDTPEMLEQAAYQLRQNKTLDEFSPLLGFFANFVLDSALVQQILRWDMVVLEESPWYNEIISRGEARGETRGRQEEACEMVLGLLNRRTGSIPPQVEIQIRSLKREQLEQLVYDLLDFTSPADLTTWLRNLP